MLCFYGNLLLVLPVQFHFPLRKVILGLTDILNKKIDHNYGLETLVL